MAIRHIRWLPVTNKVPIGYHSLYRKIIRKSVNVTEIMIIREIIMEEEGIQRQPQMKKAQNNIDDTRVFFCQLFVSI